MATTVPGDDADVPGDDAEPRWCRPHGGTESDTTAKAGSAQGSTSLRPLLSDAGPGAGGGTRSTGPDMRVLPAKRLLQSDSGHCYDRRYLVRGHRDVGGRWPGRVLAVELSPHPDNALTCTTLVGLPGFEPGTS